MHTAPAVSYPVGRSGVHRRMFAVLWALAGAATVAFALGEGATARAVCALLVFLVAFAVAWRLWRGTATGQVVWDGVTWWCDRADIGRVEGQAVPCLDLQTAVLVRFRGSSGGSGTSCWLWLERASAPLAWAPLRCALMQPRAAMAAAGVGT